MKPGTLILPMLSLGGLIFASLTVRDLMKDRPEPPPFAVPASSPYAASLAGAGIIEPSSQFIAVAPFVAGVVHEVAVVPGQSVKRGDVLFREDDRVPVAERGVRQAALDAARARLARLRQEPRAEDLPPLAARVHEMEEWLKDDRDKSDRLQKLLDRGAMQERDVVAARNAVDVRVQQLEKARADLALAKAGAWKPDLDVAAAEVASAEASVKSVETEIERLTVRAPIDGTVLQVNLRVGEAVPAGSAPQPPIVMGVIDPLHVRIDLDEVDASRFMPGAAGRAYLRGHSGDAEAIPLEFVRTEPYVVPKRELTGVGVERVDTRVLQVIYRVGKVPPGMTLYCGQQVEAFISVAKGP